MVKQENILKNSNKIYDQASEKFGHTSSAVLWDDQQTQYIRFNHLIKHISLDENVSILDIGCGNAELYKYLNFNGFKGSYTGFDINEKLLNQARKKYKTIDVQNVDILNHTIKKKYDYVVVSGLFNCNYGQDMKWVYDMIHALDILANRKVIFNAISNHVNFKDKGTFYTDPKDIMDYIITNISPTMSINHGELRFNFTTVIDKSIQWNSLNRV